MSSPYFNTYLEADVRVHPSQMKNNILENIKNNLLKKYSNKCFFDYGYIDRIYDVDDDIKGGVIRAEDNTSSSLHRVRFKCRICNPIKKSNLVGKITGINNMIIIAENGPIKFIIGSTNINTDNVQYRKSAFYPMTSKGELINKPIQEGTYVIIQVMNKKIVNNSDKIIAIGRLESVILDENVETAIKKQYEEQENISSDELLKLDQKIDNQHEHISETNSSDDEYNSETSESDDE